MDNIWGFLLQTLSVSLVALVLLLIKRIFEDKLSPRWQYGIWLLLAVRAMFPVGTRRYILLPLPLWLEVGKSWIEGMLSSAYAKSYEPLSLRHVLPWVDRAPISVTDGLFLVYGIGVVITLLWYGWGYLRLGGLLRKGMPAEGKLVSQVERVAREYGLKACSVVSIKGISSAFVYGVFQPVMVVPWGKELDDKVILHELLHLRYHDSMQTIGWCLLRALHWCNPLLQYVCYRIHCDMEALCDQRVLERLEGEERRTYGTILLEMANETYASMPGTTSISNGGKNISRRIAAIVRFKKYPKGMTLVSVCIAVILVSPLFVGTDSVYGAELYEPGPRSALHQAMAVSRLNRCSTVAGALDTYAKGLILENGIYIATVSPLPEQETLAAQMTRSSREDGWAVYHLEAGPEFDYIDRESGYSIWNIKEQKDGSYYALLAFPIRYFPGTESEEKYWEDLNSSYFPDDVTLVVPVSVRYEDGWIVEEVGERICSNQLYRNCDDGELFGEEYRSAIPFLQESFGEGKTGSVCLRRRVSYRVADTGYAFAFFGTEYIAKLEPQVDAEFEVVTVWSLLEYTHDTNKVSRGPVSSMREQLSVQTEDGGWKKVFSGYNNSLQDHPWDGNLTSADFDEIREIDFVEYVLPSISRYEMFWDGTLVDEIILQEVPDAGK